MHIATRLQELFEEAKDLIETGCWGAVWGVDCNCSERRAEDGNYIPNPDREHFKDCRVYKWREGMKEVLEAMSG